MSKAMRKTAEDFNRGYVQGWNQCLDKILCDIDNKYPLLLKEGLKLPSRRATVNPIIDYLKKARKPNAY